MFPEDMMGALGGGGGGAVPPDMLAALGGGGGMAPPPQEAPAPPAQDTVAILDQMIELALQYIDIDQDEEDKATMSKIHQMLQQYKADEQKEADGLLQGKSSPRALRRALSGDAAY